MTALKHAFQLTNAQKWHNFAYSAAVILSAFAAAAVVGTLDLDAETKGIIILVSLGLLTGLSARLGTRRGWSYYAEKYRPDASYVFSNGLKLGVLWRSLLVWLGGRCVSWLLLGLSDNNAGLALSLFVSIALVVLASLYVGLRYGWRSADTALSDVLPVMANTERVGAGLTPIDKSTSGRPRRKTALIVGGIAVIGAILGLGFFMRSGESSPPNAADQQVEDAVSKAISDPVVIPAPAESVSASASPPRAGEAATSTTTSVQRATPTPSQRDTPPLTYAVYGNVVASYFPGEPAEDAVADALSKLNSTLSVSAIDYLGYPVYALECEKNGQCVNGTGTPFGSTVEVAREMFAVNPSDVQKYALKCDVVCHDSQGQIIGSAP